MNINLIDTEALLKVPNVCKVTEYDETGEFITYLAVPVEAIKKAPAIDAVPVVRCKDCKHYGWEQEYCHGRTQHFCKLHKGLVVVGKDTFCSYGERRCDNE